MLAQLARDQAADRGRLRARPALVLLPHLAQFAHRRNAGEPLAKALHPPAFVIDREQQRRRAQVADLAGQRFQLLGRSEVAGKQNDAAHRGMAQTFTLFRRERQASHVEHDRPERVVSKLRHVADRVLRESRLRRSTRVRRRGKDANAQFYAGRARRG